ncbi:MAG: YhcH/YjgK/YiaL family protein [Prevotellaceae bacterium]|jgi:YhcH/YjgK/YiaL family protein|nr:YhcH/YjgK/YiaL family protein [Prevotellaceae bacterium]
MIIDHLTNAKKYFSLNPRFEKAFEFLINNDLSKLEERKYEIDGAEVYATFMVRQGLAPEAARHEAHDRYIDIQVCVGGREAFGWSHRPDCKNVKEAYNPEKDIIFYADKPDTCVEIKPGQFAVFFPEDAHAPLIGNGEIKKVVVKVLANLA